MSLIFLFRLRLVEASLLAHAQILRELLLNLTRLLLLNFELALEILLKENFLRDCLFKVFHVLLDRVQLLFDQLFFSLTLLDLRPEVIAAVSALLDLIFDHFNL